MGFRGLGSRGSGAYRGFGFGDFRGLGYLYYLGWITGSGNTATCRERQCLHKAKAPSVLVAFHRIIPLLVLVEELDDAIIIDVLRNQKRAVKKYQKSCFGKDPEALNPNTKS